MDRLSTWVLTITGSETGLLKAIERITAHSQSRGWGQVRTGGVVAMDDGRVRATALVATPNREEATQEFGAAAGADYWVEVTLDGP